MSETLSIVVSGDDKITADDVQRVIGGDYLRYVRITLRSGVQATRAVVHAVWPDCIETGTRDGTVHAIFPLDTIRKIERV